jgi:hypothetical protein
MKNLFKLFILFLIAVFISSCTENFDEINTNPKTLTVGNLNMDSYGYVVRNAIYGPCYLKNGCDMQDIHSLMFDVFANYFATTNPTFTSDRYELVGDWLDAGLSTFYSECAPQIKYAEDFARENGLAVEEAMMKIWKIYIYQRYTDAWGPIPYSQYGNLQLKVPYDSQEKIYNSFFAGLDSASTVLKANAGATSKILASYDPIYAGNLDKWAKFGNTLRLRLAMHIKYVEPALSKTQAEKAVADGVINDNEDNATVATTVTWYNPYTKITQWGEFRMSSDMESILKGYLDPRVQSYFSPAVTPDTSDDPTGIRFNFEGMRNGQTVSDRQGISFNEIASDMGPEYIVFGVAGPNWPVMRANESYLLRAEGALEGWEMGGTAADLYKDGIEASLKEYGYTDLKNLAGDEYSTSSLVPASPEAGLAPVSTVPVAFMTAGTKEQQLEQIITQKWIGLYPESDEAWVERRRTKYPILFPRLGSDNLDIPSTSFPTRLTFINSEYTNNSEAVLSAIEMLGGPDNGATKLWWDKK